MKDRFEKYLEEREAYFDRVLRLGRRDFLKASGMAAAAAASPRGKVLPHSFQPVDVVHADAPEKSFRFAYISDSHLYEKTLNERFVRSILKAVDDVNAMDPQPDFVLYGGDLAQLGQPKELEEGAQILKALKAPVRMMVGEHDWYLDMGEQWRKQLRQGHLLLRPQGRALRGPELGHRRGLLDGPEAHAHGAHAGHGPARQPERPALHRGRRPARLAEERPREGEARHPGHRLLPLPALQDLQEPGTSGPTTPSRCRRSSRPSRP